MIPDDGPPWRAARYTDGAFPEYRFVPGESPHPTASPRGHSYRPPGSTEPPVPYVAPGQWAESIDYLYGADLYNHAYWWEAHEAWEGLWQLTDKQAAQGRFLQGLIQTSAMHLKFHQQHHRGFQLLRHKSRKLLDAVCHSAVGGIYMGLDVPAFIEAVDRYYADLRVGQPHDPARYPYIRLLPAPNYAG